MVVPDQPVVGMVIEPLEELPYPDFDAYAQPAKELDIAWGLQIEGSRGCWWDRTEMRAQISPSELVQLWQAGLTAAQFGIEGLSSSFLERIKFGITNIRNADMYRAGLPSDVWRRLRLFNLDFDWTGPKPSWDGVREACEVWKRKYETRSRPLLFYRDGGTFLTIRDARGDRVKETNLRGLERRLYLYCCEIRTSAQVLAALAGAPTEQLQATLDRLVREELVYQEGSHFLSLAMASSPAAAVQRILA